MPLLCTTFIYWQIKGLLFPVVLRDPIYLSPITCNANQLASAPSGSERKPCSVLGWKDVLKNFHWQSSLTKSLSEPSTCKACTQSHGLSILLPFITLYSYGCFQFNSAIPSSPPPPPPNSDLPPESSTPGVLQFSRRPHFS